ncbi:MAG: hypothetical protein EAX87_04530 [Candidatus Thorarchaeota archaeon]|nr:hypothetical protein [Candidatus Thorarchaeota archaeon]
MQDTTFGEKHSETAFGKTKVIALGIMLVLSIPILVDSQDQGLAWGFNAGEKVYFRETITTITSDNTTSTISFGFYITTKDNYTIPDPLTDLPYAREEAFFYNNTPAYIPYLGFAVPIGNWDLLETVFLSDSSNNYSSIAMIGNDTAWGFRTTLNGTFTAEIRKSVFSKMDGILLSSIFISTMTFPIHHSYSEVVERVAPPFLLNYAILAAGGGIMFIGLLVVYVFTRFRSSRHSLPKTGI